MAERLTREEARQIELPAGMFRRNKAVWKILSDPERMAGHTVHVDAREEQIDFDNDVAIVSQIGLGIGRRLLGRYELQQAADVLDGFHDPVYRAEQQERWEEYLSRKTGESQ